MGSLQVQVIQWDLMVYPGSLQAQMIVQPIRMGISARSITPHRTLNGARKIRSVKSSARASSLKAAGFVRLGCLNMPVCERERALKAPLGWSKR